MRARFLVLAVLGGACHRHAHAESSCGPMDASLACSAQGEPFACAWHRAMDANPSDDDLRALFPALAGKELVDVPPVRPPAPVPFLFKSYPLYVVSVPIDWAANPEGSRTWQLEFQSIDWIPSGDAGAEVIVDWAERALPAEPPLTWAWDDATMAKRLDRVADFWTEYTAQPGPLDRRVVRAAAKIILTHLYALASPICYAAKDNHGMMENVAVLRNAHLVALDPRVWPSVLARTEAHVAASVTDDGIQTEHSPDYQVLYLGLLLDAIDAIGTPVPPDLASARDGLLEGLTYLLQPNHTLAQFGDTENNDETALLSKMIAQARAQGGVADHVEYALTDGASGSAPPLDRVFEHGGYASFRTGWDAQATGAQLIAQHLGIAHYHKDDGSFEIYGFGRELVVDSGKYDYDKSGAQTRYALDVWAHNVLTIDRESYDPDHAPVIAAHGDAWVRAAFDDYPALRGQTRTFAFAKPDAFVILDEATLDGTHHLAQHFHLAPALSDVQVSGAGVVARAPDGGASIVIVGLGDGARVAQAKTSYFPRWGASEDNVDVTIEYDRSSGPLSLAALVLVFPPGATPAIPDARYDVATRTVTWGARQVVLSGP